MDVTPLQVSVSDAWLQHFPGAHVGLLQVDNLGGCCSGQAPEEFEQLLQEIESELRQRYAGADRAALAALPVVRAYQQYYRAAGQTYPVVRQLESVALKGRPIRSPGGVLVSAMFASELESQLLTAGHDANRVVGPVAIDRSGDGEHYVGIGGQDLAPTSGDMLMRDGQGIISAVLSGPDYRTRLSNETRRAVFVTYTPVGVRTDLLVRHLERLGSLLSRAEPGARVGSVRVYPPDSPT